MLAASYRRGHGVAKDDAAAMHWYRRAAEQGHIAAQYFLGLMLGRTAPQDRVASYMWLALAAAQGDADAAKRRDALAVQMTTAQLDEGKRRASEWMPAKR